MASKYYLPIILLIAVALRVWAMVEIPLLETSEQDAVSRLWIAVQWVEKGNLLSPPSMGWLPGHGILLGLPLILGFEAVASAPIMSLLIGILLILIFYAWVKLHFGESIALVATAIMSLCPIYIYASVIPLSELPTLLFVVLGLWALDRSLLEKKQTSFYLAALSFTIANSMRIETWMITIIFVPSSMYLQSREFKLPLKLVGLLTIWPIIYTALSWFKFGVFNQYLAVMQAFAISHESHFLDLPLVFWMTCLSFGGCLILPLIAPFEVLNSKKEWPIVLGTFALLLGIVFQGIHLNIFSPRYLAVGFPLLLPYALKFIFKAISPIKVQRAVIGLILLLTVLPLGQIRLLAHREGLKASGLFEVTEWIKSNITANQALYIDGGIAAEGIFNLAANRGSENTFYFRSTKEKVLGEISAAFPGKKGFILFNHRPEVMVHTALNRSEIQSLLLQRFSVINRNRFGDFEIWELGPI